MKTVKLRIIGLCLAMALVFSGAYVTKVYADGPPGDPQDTPTNPPSGPRNGDPNHCAVCYILWFLGF